MFTGVKGMPYGSVNCTFSNFLLDTLQSFSWVSWACLGGKVQVVETVVVFLSTKYVSSYFSEKLKILKHISD